LAFSVSRVEFSSESSQDWHNAGYSGSLMLEMGKEEARLNEKLRQYFNEIAPRWDDISKQGFRDRLGEIVADLKILSGQAVLDVGCGTGVLIPFLIDKVGRNGKIVAMDIAEEMLKEAAAKGYRGNIEYIQADVHAMPFPGSTFNFIICHGCFPHFLDKVLALKEINRVLKKYGRLAITHTNSREEINRIHQSIGGVVADHKIPPVEEIEPMLSRAGFGEIVIQDKPDRFLVTATKM